MRFATLAAVLLATAACTTRQADPPTTAGAPAAEAYDLAAQRAKIARIPMSPNTAFLSAEEREVVNLLIRAAELMNPIYLRQRSTQNPTIRAEIARSQHPQKAALLDMFDLHFGPWDTLAENHPFYGGEKMPAGAGFYPEDLTKEAFDAYLAANPGREGGPDQRLYRGQATGRPARRRALQRRISPVARAGGEAARAGGGADEQCLAEEVPERFAPRPSGPTIITNPSWPGWT